jgi:uncharacterized protein (DUF2062 family)
MGTVERSLSCELQRAEARCAVPPALGAQRELPRAARAAAGGCAAGPAAGLCPCGLTCLMASGSLTTAMRGDEGIQKV